MGCLCEEIKMHAEKMEMHKSMKRHYIIVTACAVLLIIAAIANILRVAC